jgi:hypothetical protein
MILAGHSTFLRSILLSQHSYEFGLIDWKQAIAQLTGRRASDGMITIFLPDFSKRDIMRLLSCFYTGSVIVDNEVQSSALRDLWKTLRIDSIKLSDLEIDEVNNASEEDDEIIDIEAPAVTTPKRKVPPKTIVNTVTRKDAGSPFKNSQANQYSIVCEQCQAQVSLHGRHTGSNLLRYQLHLISHFKLLLFGDVPYLDKYYCPYGNCDVSSAKRITFLSHLSTHHNEFYPRITRVLKNPKGYKQKELDVLKGIVDTHLTNSLMNFDPTDCPSVADVSGEISFYNAYERDDPSGSHYYCVSCNDPMKNPDFAVLHLFLEHGEKFMNQMHILTKENERLVCCQKACGFFTWSKSVYLHHVGHKHAQFASLNIPDKINGIGDVKDVFSDSIRAKGGIGRAPGSHLTTKKISPPKKKKEPEFDHILYSVSPSPYGILFECVKCDVACLPYDSLASHLDRKHTMPVSLKCRDCSSETIVAELPSVEGINKHRCNLVLNGKPSAGNHEVDSTTATIFVPTETVVCNGLKRKADPLSTAPDKVLKKKLLSTGVTIVKSPFKSPELSSSDHGVIELDSD